MVIEPFAGSACYSVRWNVENVFLYDVSEEIVYLWEWLINCSDDDVRKIPAMFEDFDEILSLPKGAQTLVRFWVSKGRAEPSGTLSPWYFQWRSSTDCKVWGEAVKDRIIRQKPMIAGWRVEHCCYSSIPIRDAHWHIDPPYNNQAGSRYPHSNIDYQALAVWCRSLPGAVDVCENVGADWLPFQPLCDVVSSRGRRSGAKSKEAYWRNSAFFGQGAA